MEYNLHQSKSTPGSNSHSVYIEYLEHRLDQEFRILLLLLISTRASFDSYQIHAFYSTITYFSRRPVISHSVRLVFGWVGVSGNESCLRLNRVEAKSLFSGY